MSIMLETIAPPDNDLPATKTCNYTTITDNQNDVSLDPLFLITGYDSDAPEDLATNHDIYLYGDS